MSKMADFYLKVAEAAGLDSEDETTLDKIEAGIIAAGEIVVHDIEEAISAVAALIGDAEQAMQEAAGEELAKGDPVTVRGRAGIVRAIDYMSNGVGLVSVDFPDGSSGGYCAGDLS